MIHNYCTYITDIRNPDSGKNPEPENPEGVTILVYLVPELYAAETFRLQRQTTTNTILRRSVRMQMHACYPTL